MKEIEKKPIERNSEIVFLYGAKLCNPNGDPDDENKPRLDLKTQTNLVSDLRLKRYFRDYIAKKFGEKYVYVGMVEGEHVKSDKRGKYLRGQWKGNKRVERINEKETGKLVKLIPELCIDARLFGATIAIRAEGKKKKGAAINFTGPVQFGWGYSLHPVELVESSRITSVFVGKEVEKETEKKYGTMGRDYRVYYSLIGFYGVVSGMRAQKTGMRDADLKLMDNLIWDSLALEATTRSKIGQMPHLYLRVEYMDSDTILGDLRRYVQSKQDKPAERKTIRDFKDVDLDFEELISKLKKNKDKIEALYIRVSDEMKKYELKNKLGNIFSERLEKLPHSDEKFQEKDSIEKILAVD